MKRSTHPWQQQSALGLAGVVLLLAACRSSAAAPTEFEEPIGVRSEGAPGELAFELALAPARGQNPEPVLGELVTVFRTSFGACPAFLPPHDQQPAAPLRVSLQKGKLQLVTEDQLDEPARCVARSLGSQTLPPKLAALTSLDFMVQARRIQ